MPPLTTPPWRVYRAASTDALEIVDGFFHGVRAAARPADAARLGIPGTVSRRRELVPFQVLHTTGTAGQDDDVRPVPGHSDVQRDSADLDRPGFHTSDVPRGSFVDEVATTR
jgi:hypothetical protein